MMKVLILAEVSKPVGHHIIREKMSIRFEMFASQMKEEGEKKIETPMNWRKLGVRISSNYFLLHHNLFHSRKRYYFHHDLCFVVISFRFCSFPMSKDFSLFG